jgi:hypothetical protein
LDLAIGPFPLSRPDDQLARRDLVASLEHFQEKWNPVFCPKMRQRKNAGVSGESVQGCVCQEGLPIARAGPISLGVLSARSYVSGAME